VHTAERCGPKLAEYLESLEAPRRSETPQIIIIAHSLGCRLALEAVSAVSAKVRRNITLILMAAAYPVPAIVPPLSTSAASTRSSAVFYSESDEVLGPWFPKGELLAARRIAPLLWNVLSGRGPEAIGLFGRPTRRAWSERHEMRGFLHGDYWRSDAVHAEVCRLLGYATESALRERELREDGLNARVFRTRILRMRSQRR
jgi:pimeloyl-ACP methyl ester carboxylesterase